MGAQVDSRFKSEKQIALDLKNSLLRRFKEYAARQFRTTILLKGGLSKEELRDVARTFACGWSEGMAARGDTVGVHCWALAFGNITMPDWWPGDEWKFW